MRGLIFDKNIGYYPEDWSLTKLGKLGEFYSGGTPSTTIESYFGGDVTWLVPGDLTSLSDSQIFISDSATKLTQEGLSACSAKLMKKGTLCLSSRATLGEAVIADCELATNQGFINVLTQGRCDSVYLLYWIKQNKKYIERYAAGTTFLEIGRRTFKRLSIALPEKSEEQKAITEILRSVDAAIEFTENSLKSAKQLKISLMQKLLTGKLKPDGTWRAESEFYIDEKLGKIPNGWVIKKGNKITSKITKGQSPKWQGFEYQNSGILFVTSENVRNGYIDIQKAKYLPIEFNEKIKNSQLKKGDILIVIVGASVGRCAVYDLEIDIANTNQAVCVFRVGHDNCSNFISYYFQFERTQRRLLGAQVETARANLSLGDFRKFKFVIPESKKEQESISLRLNEINDLIVSRDNKIKSLNLLKMSLMQNLLTGKVRVDVEKINAILKEAQ